MTLIVNLSTLHTLHPHSKGIEALTALCNRQNSSFLQTHFSNYLWVVRQYKKLDNTLIKHYKAGIVDSEAFLEHLKNLFPFASEPELVESWNAIIALEDNKKPRLRFLLAMGEPVYLISNSNELNATKIIALLKQINPEITFYDEVDLSVSDDKNPIKIAANLYLCLSYRYQLLKTENPADSQSAISTMSLLSYLVNEQLECSIEDIALVSQYQADLNKGREIGISKEACFDDNTFFGDKNTNLLSDIVTFAFNHSGSISLLTGLLLCLVLLVANSTPVTIAVSSAITTSCMTFFALDHGNRPSQTNIQVELQPKVFER